MKKEPFKVIIEHWGESIFVGVDYSDITCTDALNLCIKALLVAGFSKNQIEDAIRELGDF